MEKEYDLALLVNVYLFNCLSRYLEMQKSKNNFACLICVNVALVALIALVSRVADIGSP
jgi:hypothetical protein